MLSYAKARRRIILVQSISRRRPVCREYNILLRAVLHIQRVFKGLQILKWYQAELELRRLRLRATKCIQCAFRSFCARRAAFKRFRAIVMIQCARRNFMAVLRAKRLRQAIKIQSFLRMIAGCNLAKKRREAISTLQRWWRYRMWLLEDMFRFKKEQRMAQLVQCFARRFLEQTRRTLARKDIFWKIYARASPCRYIIYRQVRLVAAEARDPRHERKQKFLVTVALTARSEIEVKIFPYETPREAVHHIRFSPRFMSILLLVHPYFCYQERGLIDVAENLVHLLFENPQSMLPFSKFQDYAAGTDNNSCLQVLRGMVAKSRGEQEEYTFFAKVSLAETLLECQDIFTLAYMR